MKTHKAFRLHFYGGPNAVQLDEVPVPTPGQAQVLVAVAAVGMNHYDWKIREGYARESVPLVLPFTLGVDFVGAVAASGEGATRFRVNDRVMGISHCLGAYAEHIVVAESTLARVPNSLSDVEAATLPIPILTAWGALHKAGEPRAGMRILIQGASGAVGSFAVQLAKDAGATVIGTASGKHREYVLSLGADEFIDYKSERFEELVKNVDLVLDFVGGEIVDRSWSVLAPDGAIVSVAAWDIFSKVPAGARGFFYMAQPDAARLETIAEQVANGAFHFKIAEVFGRDELLQAIEVNRVRGKLGRIIVDFKASSAPEV